MLITVKDLGDYLPINVYDANVMVVRRGIVSLDPETGMVDSLVYNRDGSPSINHESGEVYCRREFYPAPLTWKCITHEQAAEERKRCLDFEGR